MPSATAHAQPRPRRSASRAVHTRAIASAAMPAPSSRRSSALGSSDAKAGIAAAVAAPRPSHTSGPPAAPRCALCSAAGGDRLGMSVPETLVHSVARWSRGLLALALLSPAAAAHAQETPGASPMRRVEFQVERSRDVPNDLLTALMRVTHDDVDPARLSD